MHHFSRTSSGFSRCRMRFVEMPWGKIVTWMRILKIKIFKWSFLCEFRYKILVWEKKKWRKNCYLKKIIMEKDMFMSRWVGFILRLLLTILIWLCWWQPDFCHQQWKCQTVFRGKAWDGKAMDTKQCHQEKCNISSFLFLLVFILSEKTVFWIFEIQRDIYLFRGSLYSQKQNNSHGHTPYSYIVNVLNFEGVEERLKTDYQMVERRCDEPWRSSYSLTVSHMVQELRSRLHHVAKKTSSSRLVWCGRSCKWTFSKVDGISSRMTERLSVKMAGQKTQAPFQNLKLYGQTINFIIVHSYQGWHQYVGQYMSWLRFILTSKIENFKNFKNSKIKQKLLVNTFLNTIITKTPIFNYRYDFFKKIFKIQGSIFWDHSGNSVTVTVKIRMNDRVARLPGKIVSWSLYP